MVGSGRVGDRSLAPMSLQRLDVPALRQALRAANYTIDAVLDRIGQAGQQGLQRNSTIPALVAIEGHDDPQATLIKLWLLQRAVPRDAAAAALPFDNLVDAGLLAVGDEQVRALVDVRPYGAEGPGAGGSGAGGSGAGGSDTDDATELDAWVVSDLTPGLDQVVTRTRPDYVLGVSPASGSLTQMTIPTHVGSALDLGTGCGVQSLHLAAHADRVVATDINPRALQMAAITAELNQTDYEVRAGSLFEPVAGQRFDLVVTNPPYVMSPPTTEGERLVYREGTLAGDGLVRTIITQSVDHLTDGGTLQVLGNWAITADQPWQDRLASWAPPGCDLWVVERERLDVHHYIEVWLTDAGLAGSPEWEPRYREWLDYFDQLGIVGVGMGWLTVTRANRAEPIVRSESWPYEVSQPVGAAIAEHQQCWTNAALPTAELLGRNWQLASHVTQEALGEPGAEDPQHIVLRSGAGLRRAMEVDTALGGVLGACDGDLALGQITAALAQILELDEAELVASVEPGIRQALRDGLLG